MTATINAVLPGFSMNDIVNNITGTIIISTGVVIQVQYVRFNSGRFHRFVKMVEIANAYSNHMEILQHCSNVCKLIPLTASNVVTTTRKQIAGIGVLRSL